MSSVGDRWSNWALENCRPLEIEDVVLDHVFILFVYYHWPRAIAQGPCVSLSSFYVTRSWWNTGLDRQKKSWSPAFFSSFFPSFKPLNVNHPGWRPRTGLSNHGKLAFRVRQSGRHRRRSLQPWEWTLWHRLGRASRPLDQGASSWRRTGCL